MAEQGNAPIDLHRVLLEIDEEVRAKRASGELAPELERELDLVFARFAPPGAVEGDFNALLERAEQQSFIDLLAPNESARPGVPQVKRVVQKSVRWYMRYVVEQLGGFSHTITKAVRILGERVNELEQITPPADGTDIVLRRLQDVAVPWAPSLTEAFSGTSGRVLHARCGTGWLVGDLQKANVDAYGVDALSEFVAVGTASGLDLRPDDERDHLRTLAPGVLSGLVLSGSVDVLSRGGQVELIDLAALTLQRGCRLALVVTNPAVWDTLAAVPTELAIGRPMRPDTWVQLLTDRGFSDISLQQAPALESLVTVPGTDETSAAMNANIEKLNALLYPPTSFLVLAQR